MLLSTKNAVGLLNINNNTYYIELKYLKTKLVQILHKKFENHLKVP